PDLLPTPSVRALEIEVGAELRAVESPVSTRRRDRGVKAAAADGPVERGLADAEQAGRLPGGQKAGAVRFVEQAGREGLDVFRAKAPVAARGDESRVKEAFGHGTGNCRLAHAQAGSSILRPDILFQEVASDTLHLRQ